MNLWSFWGVFGEFILSFLALLRIYSEYIKKSWEIICGIYDCISFYWEVRSEVHWLVNGSFKDLQKCLHTCKIVYGKKLETTVNYLGLFIYLFQILFFILFLFKFYFLYCFWNSFFIFLFPKFMGKNGLIKKDMCKNVISH